MLAVKRYSREQFVRRSALAVGGAAGVGLLNPTGAFARAAGDPRPIPGGFDGTFTPVPSDPFIQGTARGSDGSTYGFDTDMRFMEGTYVGLDGRVHKGSFGFI
jgi:hypothetical protein